ncbi:hypothetical protein U9M48_018403, partial [Paspalum notatum var. saurae]
MKVISRPSCNIVFPKDHLFRNPPTHANIKPCQELFLANRSLILPTRKDSCLVYGVSTLGVECNNSMSTF